MLPAAAAAVGVEVNQAVVTAVATKVCNSSRRLTEESSLEANNVVVVMDAATLFGVDVTKAVVAAVVNATMERAKKIFMLR